MHMSPNFKIILHRNPAVTAWLDDGDEDWERCYVGGDGDNGGVEDGHTSSCNSGGGGTMRAIPTSKELRPVTSRAKIVLKTLHD
jgi:hypothetical protein